MIDCSFSTFRDSASGWLHYEAPHSYVWKYFSNSSLYIRKRWIRQCNPQLSVADELAKPAKLKEQGILSETEFNQMKQELF
jgi:hypothetical protein